MLDITWFGDTDIVTFPDAETALSEPDGLLAIGGNLSVSTLLNAYENGIFPWFSAGDPIMWWSPSERAVLEPKNIHLSKNMQKLLRQQRYGVTMDTAFDAVIANCSTDSAIMPRSKTWITAEMQRAYRQLFAAGFAHSVEVWNDKKQLVGGLYGVFVKNCFCGESMFSQESNTSKLALINLARFLQHWQGALIDCQLPTPHLLTLGATSVTRKVFSCQLNKMQDNPILTKKSWSDLWQRYSA
ncbi:MAG: leucyl/phenylalanyl-tRNA--protein transferase [Gammaproteobacteria bacterium]|nr:MAG: leucyl/phenylalanyl-tRNA--protein transferase [Gammaproteobacteria bacterium]